MEPVYLRNKTSVLVFYRRIKYRYELGCVWIKVHTQTSMDILFCDKTWVPMFYFDSNTTRPIVPLVSAALFLKHYIDSMLFGLAEGK